MYKSIWSKKRIRTTWTLATMGRESIVEGKILVETGFQQGYLRYSENEIIEYGKGKSPKPPTHQGIITPLFSNCHTHIGDSFLWSKHATFPHSIKALVAPPHGIKHQALEQATDKEILQGMITSLKYMAIHGTTMFWDFREGGYKGAQLLHKAAARFPSLHPIIFARPSTLTYDKQELNQLLHIADGIGLSSINEWNQDDLLSIAEQTHQQQKVFALHASEQHREDINRIIELQPDLLIHMTQGTQKDFQRLYQHNIPVVLCPHSNTFFHLTPPFTLMKKAHLRILLGTDNAMIQQPNVLDEVRMLHKKKVSTLEELLMMITFTPRKVLNSEACIHFPTSTSPFVILEPESLQPKQIITFEQDGKKK